MRCLVLVAALVCFVSAQITHKPQLPDGVSIINSVNASYPYDSDLSVFDSLARKAEVFAIGESAHGVGGYQNFQFRLSKYLITHHGYRRILHEVISDDIGLNQYLTTGQGNLRMILYLNPWQGSDVEQFNFFSWVRQYNVLHPYDMVTVHAVDPQSPWLDIDPIKEFLEKYDEEYGQTFSQTLYPTILNNCFGATFNNQIEWAFSAETTAYYTCGCLPENKTYACTSSLSYLQDVIAAEREDLEEQLGKTFVGDVEYHLRSLRSWQTKSASLYIIDSEQALRFREVVFGLNALWKATRDNPRKKGAILIAHNLHISKDTLLAPFSGPDLFYNIHTVGRTLHANLGKRYVAVAQSGYNVTTMFSSRAYPIPTSNRSIDVYLKSFNQNYLALKTSASWVKQRDPWAVHEEGEPNGRFYALSSAFDRLVFHALAPKGVFVDPTKPAAARSDSTTPSFDMRALLRDNYKN